MSSEPLLRERRGAILLLTLNRPERLNAVSPRLYADLAAAVEEAHADPGIRALVLTGAGRAFCAGADLQSHGEAVALDADAPEPVDAAAHARHAYIQAAQRANRAIQRSPLPVVAAVNGHAVGAGLELALSADLLVVARQAKLRLPEAALGTFVGGGVTWTLPRRVGMGRARELLLLGRFFTPDEALTMGLANELADAPDVLARAVALADELASRAPRSIRLLKELLERSLASDADALMAAEAEALLSCMGTADWQEGIRAHHERREPRFTGG